jgi:spermidine synthase
MGLGDWFKKLRFDNLSSKWINNESMLMMTSFGKQFFINDSKAIDINKIHNPVLYKYYLKGSWDLY